MPLKSSGVRLPEDRWATRIHQEFLFAGKIAEETRKSNIFLLAQTIAPAKFFDATHAAHLHVFEFRNIQMFTHVPKVPLAAPCNVFVRSLFQPISLNFVLFSD
ncbi:hypothetical protein BJF92_14960 [Rhizobium rhizosphaerae]|uniref:Uncharacterized protein n=1 Tax=Xaviernesmea rhizosphaerae TaxID=1672749 RepID=A0A1Q9ACR2_9HYPH|nr:hypothetical protein BJF92_14960 [Xaviernesmea rhizosphaerae]